jgi:adenine-specific DNA-methyltransferase
MKYLGNKSRLLPFIHNSLEVSGVNFDLSLTDLFGGTGSVAQHFKKQGMAVTGNDFMTYSYQMMKATIGLNQTPNFTELKSYLGIGKDEPIDSVLNVISNLKEVAGYCFENFAPDGPQKRMFFTNENAKKIDSIRDSLDYWQVQGHINEFEFDYLLASLINAADHVANMSGTYGAFLKIWRSVALKPLELRKLEIIDNGRENFVYQRDAVKLLPSLSGHVLYLDPPYNSRQYASNFHMLETLAVWDKQILRGVAGLRDYEDQKSDFSSKRLAETALAKLIENANFDFIALSYSNEGIIPQNRLQELLSSRGKLMSFQTPYKRFRTERTHENRKYKTDDDLVTEHLWVVATSN